MATRLPRAFYQRDTMQAARALLGKELVHVVDGEARRARIVETEAYVGVHDLASHSSKGVTKRTEVMYGPPGVAYVYLIYGMYHCMNVVTEPEGKGCAVLLRAVEPLANVEGNTRGPGLLCRAMGIDLTLNRCAMDSDAFHILDAPEVPSRQIVSRPRIGVAYARDWAEKELRFYIAGNPFISKK
ncbi:DNA-3-methyladenine glycosylase [Noviherbaspirillum humi]|uniref:Putative 3-methyladenine DNA glycosylase n=1 Tax=Noviherbaspirillum humi TaxID=1688639 RepID=A0A239E7H8_9BURK|nr:DNA-3-methyladenine glycosylase [Noviherbaspirillum humi]SNS40419.1 DNA-3-methyladenine glycosylase [Noviherbaspirillum humi]